MTDTMGPKGLVRSLLVYGLLTRLPGYHGHPTQAYGKATVESALYEAAQAVCEALNNRALRSQLPPSSHLIVRPGNKVRVYREASRFWEGPFTATSIARKNVCVTDG